MKLYTLDGTLLTAAWGQDPAVAGAGNPYLDLGTTVLPLPVPIVIKSSRLILDDGFAVPPGGNGLVDPPNDVLEYSIKISNEGVVVLGNLTVIDTPPAPLIYVPNSTAIDGVPVADNSAPPAATAFPLDEGGYLIPIIEAGEFTEITYQATVTVGATSVPNGVAVNGGGETISDDDTVPVNGPVVTACALSFTNSGGFGVGGYLPGEDIYVTVADGDQNVDSGVVETLEVFVTNPTAGDGETVTLTETGPDTGVYRNAVGLPFSQTAGQTARDGTLHGFPGNTLHVVHTDPVYGDSCNDSAAISPPTETKHLYLSSDGSDGDATGALDRVDPASIVPADLTTSTSTVLGGSGVISVDAVASGSGGGALANLSVGHTTGGGADRLMLVGISIEADDSSSISVSSVTYTVGASVQNLAQVGSTATSAEAQSRIYSLVAPNTGAGTVQVNFSNAGGTDEMVVGVMTFTGVDQGTPLGTYASNTGTGATASVAVSSAAGELVFDTLALDDARSASAGAGQAAHWDVEEVGSGGITGAASTEPGAGTVTMSWSLGSDNWAISAVPIRPSTGASALTFAQSAAMTGDLEMPAATSVGVTACINVVSGVMPATPDITATLRRDATTFLAINPANYVASSASCNSGPALVWADALVADVTVAVGEAVSLEVDTNEAGVSFEVLYDSNTALSAISLPTTTVITVDSTGVFDAAYPAGAQVGTGFNGQTVYVRATVSDPFGASDITSLDLVIDDPLGGNVVTTTLTALDVVATTPGSKTYEYAWTTPASEGTYPITVTAHEGYEGTVTDSGATQIALSPLDTGTPSQTEFTTGDNGPHTLTYAAGEPVCVRVTDIDENADAGVAETISVVVSGSSGDNESLVLTETGMNTGVFSACMPASSALVGTPGDGTLYAPAGEVLTVAYVDDDDATDTSGDTATVPGGGSSVSISKTLVEPADGTALIGDSVQFQLIVSNTGSIVLNTVGVADVFPNACLSFVSASPAETSVVGDTITWANVGPLAVGASVTLDVFFDSIGSCAPGVNSASVSGDASAGPVTAPVAVTGPSLSITKTNVSGSPANIGDTVTFTIDILNDGDTDIEVLPLSDTYSTCLAFDASFPVADGSGGGVAVWDDLLPGAAMLAPAATTSVTVDFTVVGACNPAENTAEVSFAEDVNGDSVPAEEDGDTVVTLAASISGQVRDDTDGDGSLGDADAGIPNTTLRLFTDPNGDGDPGDGVLVAIETTDANGDYSFIGLGLGNYVVVEEDRPSRYSTGDTFGLNDNAIPVAVSAITDYPNNDFLDSNFQAATVSGRIYEDVNGDGDYDPGTDAPQQGVDVVITDANGVEYVVTTDSNGLYSKVVPPGDTIVDVDSSTILDIASPTLTTNAAGEGNDPTVVYAPAGGIVIDNNGYVSSPQIGTVEGTVYEDVDLDGNYTPGVDTPLAGVAVAVTDVNGGVYNLVTDAAGDFRATVPAGATTVDVVDATLPPGATLDSGSTDSTVVVVPDGGVARDDTGYTFPATMGRVDGTIYLDNDASGTFGGGDTPLAGIEVEITDSLGNVYIVPTDANGYFEWPVPAGDTTIDIVDVSLPSGATLTNDLAGEGSDPTVAVVPPGGTATDNTGYVQPAALGTVDGTVYEDVDLDGNYTPGVDTPLSGVEVTVTDVNGGTYVLTTDGSGYFSRTVPAGATTVDVVDATLPSGATIDSGSTDPTVLNVPSGGTATDDTGYTFPAGSGSVNGTIYIDNNGNGLLDGGDTVLPNVEVEITDSLGGVYTVLTDPNGYFEWPVPAGDTTVDVVDATLPANATLTTNSGGEGSDPTVVAVPNGGTATDNTGYVVSPSLGEVDGTIYADLDNDGSYTPGTDTPLAGVEVTITDVNGGTYTAITDADGYFSQTVPAGNTTVDVVDATLPASTISLDSGSTDPTVVVVPDGGVATDDTGYIQSGAITGTVYGDVDNDGVYTLGVDVPFPGVDVQITDSVGTNYTLTTGADGSFLQSVAAGDATVDVVDATLPAGATLGFGSTDPTVVAVPIGGTGSDDTGYIDFLAAAVGGRIYEDVNANGTYAPGIDIPQPAVDVIVTDLDGVTYTAVTDADGLFSQIVPPGDTKIDVDEATLVGIASPNLTTDVAGEGSDSTTVYAPTGGIAYDNTGYVSSPIAGGVIGTVYVDVDQDGNYTPGTDTPLSGVPVTITDSNGGVHNLATNPDGTFSETVPAGATTVDVVDAGLPAGVTLDSGSTDPTVVNVPDGGTATDDTGYVLPAGFGLVEGTIYIDADLSGTFNVGDTALAGVGVIVADSNGDTYTVTTDVNGYFQQPVPAGDTTVDIIDATLPAGATLTTDASGEGSDATVVNVPSGGVATDNTGYVLPASLGTVDGTVYEDVDLDGNYTPGVDTPLSGVEVTVTDASGGVYNLITDGDGFFSQTVPAGGTTVDVVDATLPNGAVLDSGSTDPTVVNVPDGGAATDDTGYVMPAGSGSVNGTIYLDNDGDGTFSVGDTALPGVEVEITDSGGGVHSATTNGVGYFEWPVPAGDTTVDIVDGSLPAGASLTTNAGGEGSDLTVVTVPSGGSATDNTGYVITSTFGVVEGHVYLDTDADGIYTPGVDTPLPGVDVVITDVNGGVYTLPTDANGYFRQAVPAGSTVVDVDDATLPATADALTIGSTDRTALVVPMNGIGSDDTGYEQLPPTSTAALTATPTPTPTSTPTATPTPTFTPTFTATPTATPTVPSDLWLQKSHPAAFEVGKTGTYNFRVTNVGNGPTSGTITITDNLPNGLTFVSGGGGAWTCDAAGQLVTCTNPGPIQPSSVSSTSILVSVGSAAYPTLTNVAFVRTANDSNQSNDEDSDPTVVRLGSSTSTPVPATATPVATLPQATPIGGTPGAGTDPSSAPTDTPSVFPTPTATPTATPTPAETPYIDISLVKTNADSFRQCEVGVFHYAVRNMGHSASVDTVGPITITDTLPTGLTYVSHDGEGWSCSSIGTTVTCVYEAPLAPNDTIYLDVSVYVAEEAYPTIISSAQVSTPYDQNPQNNYEQDNNVVRLGDCSSPIGTPGAGTDPSATPTPSGGATPTPTPDAAATPTATPYLDISLVKTNTGSFTQCAIGTFEYEVRNMGNSSTAATAGPITITDILPVGLSFDSFSGDGWACSADGSVVTCVYEAVLALNEVIHLSIAVYVAEDAYPTVISSASVTTPFDSNPQNNYEQDINVVRLGECPDDPITPPVETPTPSATPTSTIDPDACDVDISSRSVGIPGPGENMEFRLAWSHTCDETFDLTVGHAIPEGMELVSVDVHGATVETSERYVSILQRAPASGTTAATITARILPSTEPDSTLCGAALVETSLGAVAGAEACFTVLAPGRSERTSIQAKLLAHPGTEITYTVRYTDVVEGHRLLLEIPDGMTLTEIRQPLPDSIDGRLMTWTNLPQATGQVSLTARVDVGVAAGTILKTLAEFEDAAGREFLQHEAIVLATSAFADGSIGNFTLTGPRSVRAGQDVKLSMRYKRVKDNGVIALFLPPGLQLLSTTKPHTVGVDGSLRWSLAGTPEKSVSGTIKAKVRVLHSLEPGALLHSYATISTSSASVEAENLAAVKLAKKRTVSSAALSAPRKVAAGLQTQIKVTAKKMPAPVTIEMTLPPQMIPVASFPEAEITETGKLRWTYDGAPGDLISPKPKVKVYVMPEAEEMGSLTVSSTTTSSLGAIVSSGVVAIKPSRSKGGSGSSSGARASLKISGSTRLAKGKWTKLKIKYTGISGSGRLELEVPPTLDPILLTVPSATVGSTGRLEWHGLRAPSGSVSVKAMVHPEAESGQLLTVNGTLTDEANSIATGALEMAVR